MTRNAQIGKSSNINIRVAPEQRSLIDQASMITHKTRTDFILDAVTKAAQDAILDQTLFQFSPEQFSALLDELDSVPQANDRLHALLHRKPVWQR